MRVNIENCSNNGDAGAKEWVLGELVRNLKELRDRTDAGDIKALDEFFGLFVFNDDQDRKKVGAGKTARPVEFLLGGTRLKLSFQQEECESCGAASAHFRTVPMDMYAEELQGRWVALVPAEDDMHMRMVATHNA